eukprot:scaffold13306_cov89-Cylindrotheca_fusiformis.AAC.1
MQSLPETSPRPSFNLEGMRETKTLCKGVYVMRILKQDSSKFGRDHNKHHPFTHSPYESKFETIIELS